jgi:hypothetical protein
VTAEQILEACKASGVTAEVREALTSLATRKALYDLLPVAPAADDRELLIALFDEEIRYRSALWHGTIEDEGDAYENIYWCAYLLYKVGDVRDVLLLWKAKRLNQDVGTELGIQYFLGAGSQPTIDFLRHSEEAAAADILKYVEESVRSPYFDGVDGFDKDRLRYFRRN